MYCSVPGGDTAPTAIYIPLELLCDSAFELQRNPNNSGSLYAAGGMFVQHAVPCLEWLQLYATANHPIHRVGVTEVTGLD